MIKKFRNWNKPENREDVLLNWTPALNNFPDNSDFLLIYQSSDRVVEPFKLINFYINQGDPLDNIVIHNNSKISLGALRKALLSQKTLSELQSLSIYKIYVKKVSPSYGVTAFQRIIQFEKS